MEQSSIEKAAVAVYLISSSTPQMARPSTLVQVTVGDRPKSAEAADHYWVGTPQRSFLANSHYLHWANKVITLATRRPMGSFC